MAGTPFGRPSFEKEPTPKHDIKNLRLFLQHKARTLGNFVSRKVRGDDAPLPFPKTATGEDNHPDESQEFKVRAESLHPYRDPDTESAGQGLSTDQTIGVMRENRPPEDPSSN